MKKKQILTQKERQRINSRLYYLKKQGLAVPFSLKDVKSVKDYGVFKRKFKTLNNTYDSIKKAQKKLKTSKASTSNLKGKDKLKALNKIRRKEAKLKETYKTSYSGYKITFGMAKAFTDLSKKYMNKIERIKKYAIKKGDKETLDVIFKDSLHIGGKSSGNNSLASQRQPKVDYVTSKQGYNKEMQRMINFIDGGNLKSYTSIRIMKVEKFFDSYLGKGVFTDLVKSSSPAMRILLEDIITDYMEAFMYDSDQVTNTMTASDEDKRRMIEEMKESIKEAHERVEEKYTTKANKDKRDKQSKTFMRKLNKIKYVN